MLLHTVIRFVPSPHGGVLLGFAALAWRGARMPPDSEAELLTRLRAGDEEAFLVLVDRHQATMLRLARSFVPSAQVAEEVVQETWLGVLRGIDRFAGRSSLRTWLLAILVNRARSAGASEGRSVAVADVEPAVAASRFDGTGAWSQPPRDWVQESNERLDAAALADYLRDALGELPARQREVVLLRDVEGLTGAEVSEVLGVSEGNQRVLLHRGRSRLRQALEDRVEVA